MANRERLKQRRQNRAHKEKAYRLEYDAEHRGEILVKQAGRRSKKKGVPFDLDAHLSQIEERVQRGVCEMTGLAFNFYCQGVSWNSPSLDRIDPTRGYIYDNIRVVCFGMNAALGNWGEKVLRMMLDAWLGRK